MAAVIGGAILAAYIGGLHAPFVMDDFSSITANRSIRSLVPIRDVLIYGHDEGRTIDGRPLLNLSLAVNRALTGPAPAGFRAANILIHWANALLLMGLCHRLLGARQVPEAIRACRSEISFAASLLWAVHPLGTSGVTYVIQRAESLATLLLLATVSAVVAGISAANAVRSSGLLPVVVILALLAGTAKETAVVIPLVTILIDRALLSGSWRGTLRHWPWHLAAAASWPSVALMLTALGGRGSSAGFSSGASPWLYLLTQARAIWLYLARIVWPRGLVFDYGDFLSSGLAESGGWLVLTAAVFAAVVYGYARSPVVFLGPLLFFVLLGPTSSIIPVKTQTIAEHRAYLASAAIVVPAVAAAYRFAVTAGMSRRTLAGLLAATSIVLGVGTAARNREFATPELLWRKALAAEPRNERAMLNLASQLVDRKEYDEAERLLAAVEATGRYERTMLVNRARMLKAQGQFAAACSDYDRILEFTPDDASVLADRGYTRWKRGDLAAARADLDRALALDPVLVAALINRGNVRFDGKDIAGALADFERAVAVEPASVKAWSHTGLARQELGDRQAALAAFDRAVSCDPADPEARYNRANLLVLLERPADAVADYGVAIGSDPRFRDAYFNRGVVHLRAGRLGPARADIEAFSRLGGRPPDSVLRALGVQRGND
jgi:tetratricopeptide (TPR) repeat protein